MMVVRSIVALAAVALTAAAVSPAYADPREVLRVCQAVIKRADQSAQDASVAKPDEAEIVRCRQVIRDWTLRESRMSVDEEGRPLR
jgi:hypothetical protein